jgi:RNA polymerase sigma-70 factor (family 1)
MTTAAPTFPPCTQLTFVQSAQPPVPQSDHTDKELFHQIAGGDQSAFAELFRRYDRRIYPFVLKMIKEDSLAEEIAQEIFVKLWDQRAKLATVDNPESWLLTLAAHHTLDQIQKRLNERKMLRRLFDLSKNAATNDTEETLQFRESNTLVQQAVDRLPLQQKKVYRLSREEGLNYREIGVRLNISPNTVRNHLVEALRSIRIYLDEKGSISFLLVAWMELLLKK